MELHKNKGEITVVIDLSYSSPIDEIKNFILREQCPFIESQIDKGLVKFEWFIDEASNKATLLEIFENPEVWEDLANKVIGTPVNIKFGQLFNIEKMTILGEPTQKLQDKLQAMKPTTKLYVGGIN